MMTAPACAGQFHQAFSPASGEKVFLCLPTEYAWN